MPFRRAMRAVAVHTTHGIDAWLGIGSLAKQTREYVYVYGFAGLFLPLILSPNVFHLVQSVLQGADDDDLISRFADSQTKQVSSVAMIGSIIAGNAVAALGKPNMSAVPWPAAAFMHASLVAALFCVYHSMRLNRIMGALVTPDAIKQWLRSSPSKVRCRDKNRPSVSAVLILDTPRTLVTMASVSFVVGWSIYVFYVYIYDLDQVAGLNASMNIMIFYAASLWFAVAVYLKADIFDYYTERDHTWLAIREMIVAIIDLFTGRSGDGDEEEAYVLPDPVSAVPAPAAQQAVRRTHPSAEPRITTVSLSERSDRQSLGSMLLAEALRESVEARRKAIEADEQFVRALEMYQPGGKSGRNG